MCAFISFTLFLIECSAIIQLPFSGGWFDGASFDRGDRKIVSMVNDILTDIISDINEEKML